MSKVLKKNCDRDTACPEQASCCEAVLEINANASTPACSHGASLTHSVLKAATSTFSLSFMGDRTRTGSWTISIRLHTLRCVTFCLSHFNSAVQSVDFCLLIVYVAQLWFCILKLHKKGLWQPPLNMHLRWVFPHWAQLHILPGGSQLDSVSVQPLYSFSYEPGLSVESRWGSRQNVFWSISQPNTGIIYPPCSVSPRVV